jgi:hypothetical protein
VRKIRDRLIPGSSGESAGQPTNQACIVGDVESTW